jgi:hypothetical protein
MTIPKRWTPSDPITAERLNVSQAEASRPRRDIVLGNGSSMVNEQLGNQSANMRAPLVKLVVALEDFAIPETPTDVPGMVDDVPSGLVREVRLDRKSSTHANSESERSFLAYDVTGGLSGEICPESGSASVSASTSASGAIADSRMQCDVFYVMFNLDSKRWEVLNGAGGGIELYHGVILERCNQTCSTYRVQRVHRYLTAGCPTCSDSESV